MTRTLDSKGRPIVAVTGMGVVTSLGQGQADNWSALCSGGPGIEKITRFPTAGLRTVIAGTVDFLDVEPFSAPALTMRMAALATEEALGEAGLAGAGGRFAGPLLVATPPAELEWPQRKALWDKAADSGQ